MLMQITEKIFEIENKIQDGSCNFNDYLNLGNLYLDSGNFNKLINLYSKLEKLNISSLDLARIYYEKGQAFQFSVNIEKAISSFEQSINILKGEEATTDSIDLKGLNHYNLFLINLDSSIGLGHAKEAIKHFKWLTKKSPNCEKKYLTRSHLADIYGRLGEYQKALHNYDQALKENLDASDLVWVLSGIASIYAMKKEYDRADQLFKQALSKGSRDDKISKIYYDMGKMYFDANRLPEAEKAFRNALECKRDDPRLKENQEYEVDIAWHLGTLSYELNNYDDMIIYLNKVLGKINDKHPYYSNSYLTLGHYSLMIENFEEARGHYNQVLTSSHASDEEIMVAKECLAQIPLNS